MGAFGGAEGAGDGLDAALLVVFRIGFCSELLMALSAFVALETL